MPYTGRRTGLGGSNPKNRQLIRRKHHGRESCGMANDPSNKYSLQYNRPGRGKRPHADTHHSGTYERRPHRCYRHCSNRGPRDCLQRRKPRRARSDMAGKISKGSFPKCTQTAALRHDNERPYTTAKTISDSMRTLFPLAQRTILRPASALSPMWLNKKLRKGLSNMRRLLA